MNELSTFKPQAKPYHFQDAGSDIVKWILSKTQWVITSTTHNDGNSFTELSFQPSENAEVICRLMQKNYSIGFVTNIKEIETKHYAEIIMKSDIEGCESVLATTPLFDKEYELDRHLADKFDANAQIKKLTKETIIFLN